MSDKIFKLNIESASKEELKDLAHRFYAVLQAAIPNAYHTKECEYTLNPKSSCTCWVESAYGLLDPKPCDKIEPIIQGNDTAPCSGGCVCQKRDHTVKVAPGIFGCSKMNCGCMEYVPLIPQPIKAN